MEPCRSAPGRRRADWPRSATRHLRARARRVRGSGRAKQTRLRAREEVQRQSVPGLAAGTSPPFSPGTLRRKKIPEPRRPDANHRWTHLELRRRSLVAAAIALLAPLDSPDERFNAPGF